MTYLTEKDYLYLYPYLSPQEIKEEYADHSKGARAIQKLYKDKGYAPYSKKLAEIIKERYLIVDLDAGEEANNHHFWEEIEKERSYRKEAVWARVRLREELE